MFEPWLQWALIPALLSGFLTLFVKEVYIQKKVVLDKHEQIPLP
jgi:hypothetical protein